MSLAIGSIVPEIEVPIPSRSGLLVWAFVRKISKFKRENLLGRGPNIENLRKG
jgi:hypothetical protein